MECPLCKKANIVTVDINVAKCADCETNRINWLECELAEAKEEITSLGLLYSHQKSDWQDECSKNAKLRQQLTAANARMAKAERVIEEVLNHYCLGANQGGNFKMCSDISVNTDNWCAYCLAKSYQSQKGGKG
jgi:hypothetical protein